jgi:hypothetical protein
LPALKAIDNLGRLGDWNGRLFREQVRAALGPLLVLDLNEIGAALDGHPISRA